MSARPAIRGWCPGALRPMLSGDGYVVRLRLSCNEASLALVREIADWAETCGNGLIDLSARANLQIRGVTEATLPALTQKLAEAGLTDASPEAEAVRNVIVAPLAGFDSAAPFDMRPHARALERELASNRDLWALPGKFGFAFDAGAFPLGRAADVIFAATAPDAFVANLAGEATLGPFPAGQAVAVAVKLARAFLALRSTDAPPRRMRDALALHGLAPFVEATGLPRHSRESGNLRVFALRKPTGPDDVRSPRVPAFAGTTSAALGVQALGEQAFVGLALPFGRITAADLRALARLATLAAAPVLRLTPWRAILVPGLTPPAAHDLAEAARGLDLILDPADPRLAVAACPGAPACSSALGETRAAASRLAPLAGAGLHVSGCAKGCAHPAPAPVTVVATAAGYDLVADGRADAAAQARGLSLAAVETLLKERAA